MLYSIVKSEKNIFAVYQTIYSNADTNANFDWEARLDDTKWTDECYWVINDGQKIGGILILEDTVKFPFLITPFCDRYLFWRIILKHIKMDKLAVLSISSILDEDVQVLLTFGYKIDISRRIMCRPTEKIKICLDACYEAYKPDIEKDLDAMVSVTIAGYKCGIDYQLFGEGTEDEARQDILYFFEGYIQTKTLSQSLLIREKITGNLVAYISSGRHPKENRERFSSIADIVVLPEHRGKGIGEYLIRHALSEAAETSDVLRLCVTVGNNSEALYRKLGFFGSPRFTSMSLRSSWNELYFETYLRRPSLCTKLWTKLNAIMTVIGFILLIAKRGNIIVSQVVKL